MRRCLKVVLLVLGISVPAWGDLVVAEGGESFSGAVVRIADGILVFRTELSGQMMMPMDTVEALTTERSMAVSLQDGTVLYGAFGEEAGAAVIQDASGGDAQSVALDQVNEALPVPRTSEPASPPANTLSGTAEIGLRARTGNRDSLAPVGRLQMNRSGSRYDFESSIMLEGEDGRDFPQGARGRAELRRNRPGGFMPFGAVDVERDQYDALDLRTQLTLGLQRELFDDQTHSLRALLGLGYAYEDWDLQYLRRVEAGSFGRRTQHLEDEMNLPLGLRYSRVLFENGSLTSDLTLYPSLSNGGDLRTQSLSTFSYPVSERLRLRLNLEMEYDNSRPFDGLNDFSTSVGAGLGVDF